MALFANLGDFKNYIADFQLVEWCSFVKNKPLCGDILGKLTIVYRALGLGFKLFETFNTQQAHLPVPDTGMSIADHSLIVQFYELNRVLTIPFSVEIFTETTLMLVFLVSM